MKRGPPALVASREGQAFLSNDTRHDPRGRHQASRANVDMRPCSQPARLGRPKYIDRRPDLNCQPWQQVSVGRCHSICTDQAIRLEPGRDRCPDSDVGADGFATRPSAPWQLPFRRSIGREESSSLSCRTVAFPELTGRRGARYRR
jgi:hypothetical protein